MNIQQAKDEISNTLRVYLQRNAEGNYSYPTVRQRPLFLIGPPGVGKTAIVQQIAQKWDLPLVAYTMTHHTRQSAVGLPQIRQRSYCGETFSITEYTMSEIIGTVYRAMEETGKRQGILFLDEINCVSETLAPTMLQFLQNKTFGNHALPEGWVIVAAGNPPEYNKSVRPFDIVTLDRIRNITVEADVQAFLNYGFQQGLHGAVLSYLKDKPEKFYYVRRRENCIRYVTARGWEDLSRLLQSYETLDIPVTESIIAEFLCHEDICRDFFACYCLYVKYGRDYAVGEILSGSADAETWADRITLAKQGDFTERFFLTNHVLEQLIRYGRAYHNQDTLTASLQAALKGFLNRDISMEAFLENRQQALEVKQQFHLISGSEMAAEKQLLQILNRWNTGAKENRCHTREQWKTFLQEQFRNVCDERQISVMQTGNALVNAITFLTDAFGDGQELTLLLTGITASSELMDYICRHGCAAYIRLSDRLQHQCNERSLQKKCLAAMEK